MAAKDNQKQLHQNIQDEFKFSKTIKHSTDLDMGHDRTEIRTCSVITGFQFIEKPQKWKNLKSIVKIESVREFKNSDKPTETATRYYMSSLDVKATNFQRAIRSHWGIENKLHWVLDVAFSEDASRKRTGNASKTFLYLTKQHSTY